MRDKRVKMLVYSQNALFQFLSPKLSTRNSPEIAVRTKRFQPKSKPMPALSETVNKVCKSSWMKHTRETANGNKIITGFILMTKNITQHLTNQLSHAVTSFWWCNQLYTSDPHTMWGPADKSDVLRRQKHLSIWSSLQEQASLYTPGWVSHLSSLSVIEHLQGSNILNHGANSSFTALQSISTKEVPEI